MVEPLSYFQNGSYLDYHLDNGRIVILVYVFWNFGYAEGLKYVTAYVAEKSLSVDNLFVFLVIFGYFAVPFAQQHKTLFLGILGAVILRGAFIFLGIALLERFHWMVYVFGVVLIYSGYRLARGGAERVDQKRIRLSELEKGSSHISEVRR